MNPNTPPSPQTPDRPGFLSRLYKHGVNWPVSIGATVVATVGLSAAIHAPNYKKGSAMDRVHSALTWENTRVVEEEISRTTKFNRTRTYSTETVGGQRGFRKFKLAGGDQVYAEDFADDPRAGEFIDKTVLKDVIEELHKEVFEHGNRIFSLTFRGYASAEDEAPDGGLTTPSVLNRKLARKRAQVALRDFNAELLKTRDGLALADIMSNLHDNTKVQVAPGIEQELTKPELHKLEGRAFRAGYRRTEDKREVGDAQAFVDTWNDDPTSVKKRDRQYLKKLLGSARKVEIKAVYGKEGKTIYKLNTLCLETTTINIKTKSEKHDDDLSFPIPLPIIWPRLRRKEKAEPEPGPKVPPKEPEPTTTEKLETAPVEGKRGFPWLPPMPPMPRNWPEGFKLARKSIPWLGIVALLAFVNESGQFCNGEKHKPIPWPGAFAYHIYKAVTGSPEESKSNISFGIPFSDSLQIDLFRLKDVPLGCPDQTGQPGPGTPRTGLPKCTQIEVMRKNGKEISRRVVFETGPYKTQTVTTPTR